MSSTSSGQSTCREATSGPTQRVTQSMPNDQIEARLIVNAMAAGALPGPACTVLLATATVRGGGDARTGDCDPAAGHFFVLQAVTGTQHNLNSKVKDSGVWNDTDEVRGQARVQASSTLLPQHRPEGLYEPRVLRWLPVDDVVVVSQSRTNDFVRVRERGGSQLGASCKREGLPRRQRFRLAARPAARHPAFCGSVQHDLRHTL
mmetsp:Transcript_18444/g.65302  ORF Transcript_18444/g.65302 Transcript_18444/m.65302 type:complete len:204 (-) Transcript_18444:769-1380(-)